MHPYTFTDLVRKTGTSATSHKKRLTRMKKRLKLLTTELQRMGKEHSLRAVAVTLTYPAHVSPDPKHISRFVATLRTRMKRIGLPLPYAWVLEYRRAFHYHMVLWLPRTTHLTDEDLARMWPHGYSEAESCRSPWRWMKYLGKSETKEKVPAALRVFGHSRLDEVGRQKTLFAGLPQWLAAALPALARPRRVARIGWIDLMSGEVFQSPYEWTPWGVRLKEVSIMGAM